MVTYGSYNPMWFVSVLRNVLHFEQKIAIFTTPIVIYVHKL